MSLIGYARVSTLQQNLDLQMDALTKAGCSLIFADKMSGAFNARPELRKALEALKTGDTLVVWKLDRLGRSLSHLIEVVQLLKERGIGFKTIQDNLDASTTMGKLIFHFFAALSEFEREITLERTAAGLEAAKRRGKRLGRKPSLTNEQIALAVKLIDEGKTREEAARLLKVSYQTLYRALLKKAA